MSFFTMRKPRGFHHDYIYYDQSKARLREMEDKARRELGLKSEDKFNPQLLHGAFVRATNHLRRRKEKEQSGRTCLNFGKILFLIIALLALWFFLAR